MKNLLKPKFIALISFILIVSSCTEYGSTQRSLEIAPLPDEEAIPDILSMEEMEVEESMESGELFFMISPQDGIQLKFNTEEYTYFKENAFQTPWMNPLSTFSIDVDNASYSNVRRIINHNSLPPIDAVRIEEMINYFDYDYPEPQGTHPFSVTTELGSCPWKTENYLLHVGIQGKSLNYDELNPGNYVFLIDVSGSMDDPAKLPLVKKSLKLMLKSLAPSDKVSIVVYAGNAGLVLPSTPVREKATIYKAIENLKAGGSTAGGEGIVLAYNQAMENLIEGGNNRVILATDGDFNVGVSSSGDLVRLIEEKRDSGIYLTICGFGMGNYKDSRMEDISNAGNGNYFYIDNAREADKVFSRELRANLFTIAKDVKIQIEFNPRHVKAYRLIGYENRTLNNEDFKDDTKDAGELGAGHSVTALYEIIPQTEKMNTDEMLKFQKRELADASELNSLVDLKLRYKPIGSNVSILIHEEIANNLNPENSSDFHFSAAVAGFGMLLRNSSYSGELSFEKVKTLAGHSNPDQNFDREEFVQLVNSASILKSN